MSDLKLALSKIQQSLNAPKGQWNDYSSYHYRSAEDILEGLKKVLEDCVVTVSDDIVAVGNRIYVKATATISLGTESESVTAFAREAEKQKGMTDAQLTGTTSSYARKYALNGLFLIDDNKDDDSNEQSRKVDSAPVVINNKFGASPEIDLINEAIKNNDINFVKMNWTTTINKNWSSLTAQQTDALNKIFNGAS
jgi:hypothetical protein